MRVLVTGATGFTGSYTVPLLLKRGFQVNCFVRETSDLSVLPLEQVQIVCGDLDDLSSLIAAMTDVDVLINIASIGFGHAPKIVEAALCAQIKRAVFISTTAIFTSLNASSKTVRTMAEQTIFESSLSYTVLRPTMIYGSSRDRNICRLIAYLRRWPVVPVLGTGEYLQQPVYVGDVASAIVDVVQTQATIGKAYDISGGTVITYNELIDTIAGLLGREVRRVHLPPTPFIVLLVFLERLPLPVPIKSEQIKRLNEDKDFSFEKAAVDFGYKPRVLVDGLRLELQEMYGVS